MGGHEVANERKTFRKVLREKNVSESFTRCVVLRRYYSREFDFQLRTRTGQQNASYTEAYTLKVYLKEFLLED
jgi:hypothetical protein